MTTGTPAEHRRRRRSPAQQILPEPGEPGFDDLVVNSLQDLFDAFKVDTLNALSEMVEIGAGLDLDAYVEEDSDSGLIVVVEGRGVVVPYSFTITDLLETASEQEVLVLAQWECEELAEAIEKVEGFAVRIWPADEALSAQPRPYPYRRACSGTTSLSQWLDRRVFRHYPEVGVEVTNPDGSGAFSSWGGYGLGKGGSTMLKTVRRRWLDAQARARRDLSA
jgi:hypothetical protein